jgi:hypothetical protein
MRPCQDLPRFPFKARLWITVGNTSAIHPPRFKRFSLGSQSAKGSDFGTLRRRYDVSLLKTSPLVPDRPMHTLFPSRHGQPEQAGRKEHQQAQGCSHTMTLLIMRAAK